MAWHARLQLDLRRQAGRSVARFEHEGPLRLLQTLYPEGDATSHHVLVHPPSGLVAGDRLAIGIDVGEAAHGVLTTPGAGRFYRSEGEAAVQDVRLRVAGGGRFEWLPLETLYYSGCRAENRLAMDLAPDAEVIGWDVAALGLPASKAPFTSGSVLQHLALGDRWLERGRIDAADARLLDGPLGLAGHRCLATLWWACGSPIAAGRRELALEVAREAIAGHALARTAGATSPADPVVVVRCLAPLVEPAMALLRQVRARWRQALWQLPGTEPRSWAV